MIVQNRKKYYEWYQEINFTEPQQWLFQTDADRLYVTDLIGGF